MSLDQIFSICSSLAMLGWVLLIFVPTWKFTKTFVQAGVIPLILGIVYAVVIIPNFGSAEGGFGSLSEVTKLFGSQAMILAGWIHYLAFDLWVGHWEAGDAAKNGINRWIIVPCLLLTFMFGPVGLLLYIVIRTIKTKKILDDENFRVVS